MGSGVCAVHRRPSALAMITPAKLRGQLAAWERGRAVGRREGVIIGAVVTMVGVAVGAWVWFIWWAIETGKG